MYCLTSPIYIYIYNKGSSATFAFLFTIAPLCPVLRVQFNAAGVGTNPRRSIAGRGAGGLEGRYATTSATSTSAVAAAAAAAAGSNGELRELCRVALRQQVNKWAWTHIKAALRAGGSFAVVVVSEMRAVQLKQIRVCIWRLLLCFTVNLSGLMTFRATFCSSNRKKCAQIQKAKERILKSTCLMYA